MDDTETTEHATYVTDVRRARRERLAWRTAAVIVVLLAAGPTWQALRNGSASASQKPPASDSAGAGSLAPLDPGDPMPVAPEGTGDVTHLRPAMLRAVERATTAAAADGVRLRVTSGWRSAAKQQQLYDAAVAKYGSAEKARRWVLPPDESEHVKGGAVDVGPVAAAAWLERNGVRFGLCRRYANEPWHFERLAPATGQLCPAMEPHA